MFNLDQSTKIIGLFTAVIALVGGGYTGLDKINSSLKDKAILIWSPEHFNISNGPADGDFQVYVARKKLRDDCKVVDFTLEVRDSKFNVYHVTPSISVFSGPAGPDIEKFGYKFKIDNNQKIFFYPLYHLPDRVLVSTKVL